MIHGAIFDLDGTLLDSMPYWDSVGAEYMRTIGIDVSPEVQTQVQAISMSRVAEYLISYYNLNTSIEDFKIGVYHLMKKAYIEKIPFKPGVDKFLQELKNRGVKMCIATATAKPLAEAALKRLGIREYFEEIFTVEETGVGKDKPDLYRLALKNLGTKKEETFIAEDLWKAMETAHNDGFKCVGVYDNREGPNQEKLKSFSDYYLESFNDFENCWKALND